MRSIEAPTPIEHKTLNFMQANLLNVNVYKVIICLL